MVQLISRPQQSFTDSYQQLSDSRKIEVLASELIRIAHRNDSFSPLVHDTISRVSDLRSLIQQAQE